MKKKKEICISDSMYLKIQEVVESAMADGLEEFSIYLETDNKGNVIGGQIFGECTTQFSESFGDKK